MEKEFDFKYRENGYFNESDTYLVQTHNTVHEAKATFEKGFWWFNNHWKATSVECVNLTKFENQQFFNQQKEKKLGRLLKFNYFCKYKI